MQHMQKFRFLEHTADVLFEAYGTSESELFHNAALALEEVQVRTDSITPKTEWIITKENDKLDMLLFDFLQELIYLKDAEQLLFSTFKVHIEKQKDGKYHLDAHCTGEKIDPKKHKLDVDAKAITLHQFEVKKEKEHWKARVLVDI